MSQEVMKILDMVKEGIITAEQGAALISAQNEGRGNYAPPPPPPPPPPIHPHQFFGRGIGLGVACDGAVIKQRIKESIGQGKGRNVVVQIDKDTNGDPVVIKKSFSIPKITISNEEFEEVEGDFKEALNIIESAFKDADVALKEVGGILKGMDSVLDNLKINLSISGTEGFADLGKQISETIKSAIDVDKIIDLDKKSTIDTDKGSSTNNNSSNSSESHEKE